jgi:hypothetical protein
MSSVFTPDITTKYGLASSASAPNSPAAFPRSRRPANQVRNTAASPVRAVQRRAVHSEMPNASYAIAVAQYWSGGFCR